MYGFFYSLKENFSFTRKELTELLWTSIAFAFIMTAFIKGFMYKPIVLEDTLWMFVIFIIGVFASLWFHVALQKIVGIKLGYKVTYTYWLNGVLICLFLSFLTFGMVPLLSTFIFPGAVTMEHLPKLRLGKFRYGTNSKDIARVSLAGPLSHIIIVLILGIVFLSAGLGRSSIVFLLISLNLLIAIYSILPIPKIDMPTKMDSASDGMGLFFFSRTIYVLCFATILFYALLVWIASVFSLILAFVMAFIATMIYIVVMEQKN